MPGYNQPRRTWRYTNGFKAKSYPESFRREAVRLAVMGSINRESVAQNRAARGFSCEVWVDPPGRRWEGFVHTMDELVMVIEGEMECVIDGEVSYPEPGEEVNIPAGTVHSVRNVGASAARWLYGYRQGEPRSALRALDGESAPAVSSCRIRARRIGRFRYRAIVGLSIHFGRSV